ncbi:MAG: hypothetical protein H0X36_06445 [Sphingomonadaceae bacterium]|nr:hypothetical protein [Sphingomonadaceae bacterium]
MLILLPILISAGCVRTVASAVTAPVKIVGHAADWATTSQDEADRNRGRALRKAEEHARKDCKRQVDGDVAREQCVRDSMRARGFS